MLTPTLASARTVRSTSATHAPAIAIFSNSWVDLMVIMAGP